MENNHREQSLGDKLRNYEEAVDQSALWEGIRHQIPIKRKKYLWPIPLVFLLGAGFGFGITEYSYINYINTLKYNNKNLTSNIQSLKQSLQTCSQQKEIQNNAGIAGQEPAKTKAKRVAGTPIFPVWATSEHSTQKTQSPYISEAELLKTAPTEETKTATMIMSSDQITSLPTPVLQFNQTPSWQVVLNPTFNQPESKKIPLVWFLEFGAGPSLVSDKGFAHDEVQISKHQSLFSVQVDAGIQKRLLSRLYGNLGISYQSSASKQTYHTSSYENIFITDTMGLFIGTDGVTRVNIGEVLAQKWITKSGEAYHTRQMVSLRPGVEYELFSSKGKHLSLGLSLAIPIWFQNTGSLVNDQTGKQLLSKNQFLKPEWPWSLGIYYQWPMQSSSLGLLLRVHHDKQKIVFNDKIYARNFWLPQAGMRILF